MNYKVNKILFVSSHLFLKCQRWDFSWGTAKRARKADTQKGNITGRIGLD